MADRLCRVLLLPHEWCLNHSVANRIFLRWGQPCCDLFASPFDKKCSRYIALIPPQGQSQRDALSPCLAFQSTLCIPSSCSSDSQISSEGMQVEEQSDTHCPILASTSLIHLPVVSCNLPSMALQSHPDLVSPLRANPAGSSQLETNRVVSPVLMMTRQSRLSFPVHQILISSDKSSTRKIYKSKWKEFSIWAQQHQIDPLMAPTSAILDFLAGLCHSGASFSTVKAQLAAISNFHIGENAASLASSRLCKAFLKATFLLLPPVKDPTPLWNFMLVLQALTLPPFEPTAKAELNFLFWIKVLLVAITSAKRVFELQA